MKIAVILPSRGLVFSETVEELLRELKPYDHQIFWSHGRPIPDCFEIPTQEALKGDFTHLLTVEEDMIIPPGTLESLLEADTHAIACDYPVTGNKGGTILYDTSGKAFFTGCGFLLVRMELIRALKPPIWRDDLEWNMDIKGAYVRFNIKEVREAHYGQQDIAFGLRLYANNLPIQVSDKDIGQRKLRARGEGRTNHGYHDIEEWREIKKHDMLVGQNTNKGNMTDIVLKDGTKIVATPDQVQRFVSSGNAELLRIRDAEFHNTEHVKDWLWV